MLVLVSFMLLVLPSYTMPLSIQMNSLPHPRLLKDINSNIKALSSTPQFLTVVGDQVLFFATDTIHGFGLWRSDGSEDSTNFVRETGTESWVVRGAAAIGSYVVFVLKDDTHGTELWRSDGTAVGTTLVTDLNPGPEGAFGPVESMLMSTGRRIFFTAHDGTHGWGLWTSDGTATGTTMLREIGPYTPNSSSPLLEMVPVGDRLYFAWSDPDHGRELWMSDGTPTGTHIVRDINPGSARSNPYAFGVIGETLLLTVDDGVHGYELWRSDGTESGTRMVADINPGAESSRGRQFVTAGSRVFFLAEDGLHGRQVWQSDGTPSGTIMVPRLPDDMAPLSEHTQLHTGGGCIFVEAYDTTPPRLLASCNGAALAPLGLRSSVYSFATVQGRAVFSTENELWVTDGTAHGTTQIAQRGTWRLTPFRDQVIFAAADPVHGTEPWISDGTVEGTRLVKDINVAPAGSGAICMYQYGDQVFFRADDGTHGHELWQSDGTPEGTALLADLVTGPDSSYPCDFAPFGGALVFKAANKLWRTDGTLAGTALITTPDQPDGVAANTGLTVVDDQGFFTVESRDNSLTKHSLWVLDADLRSAHHVFTFYLTGKYGSSPLTPRYSVGHRLVFGFWKYYEPRELWTSDGTHEGTRMIARNVSYLDSFSAQMFFIRFGNGEGGNFLWATDGTVEGTLSLSNPLTEYTWSPYHVGDSFAGRLFFATSNSGKGWIAVSDGTAAGTQVFRQLADQVDSLVATHDGAFFVQIQRSPDSMYAELWHTDGTGDGTVLLRSFESPNWNVRPEQLTLIENRLLFVKGDEAHGVELWQSDGSPEGTYLCQDLNPGPRSAAPRLDSGSAVLGENLILAVDDGVHGEELWSLPLNALCGTVLYLPRVAALRGDVRP